LSANTVFCATRSLTRLARYTTRRHAS